VKHWVFKDYQDASGGNVILAWLNTLPKTAKIRINIAIQRLEVMDRLPVKLFKPIPGAGRGLWELRIRAESVQYRPICYHGPGRGEITILAGEREIGGKFDPLSACSTAQMRKTEVSEEGNVCDHDFS
jgi:hypothetical protein